MKFHNHSKQVNNWVAKKLTLSFGTMWMCYVFMIYGLLPVLRMFSPYMAQMLYWSNWVQLWSLPLLLVGVKVVNAGAEERAEQREQETHDKVMAEFDELGNMMTEMAATHAEVHEMMSQVHVRVVGPASEVDVNVSE